MTSEKVLKCGIIKDKKYLYFVDKEGDISRALLTTGRKPGVGKKNE